MSYDSRRDNYWEPEAARNGLHVLYAIIGLNIIFAVVGPIEEFMLIPFVFSQGAVWQIVTSMFMHNGFDHCFWNMLTLFFFGPIVARALGPWRFLILYMAAGIGGNLLWLLANWNTAVPLLGASGAVFGVLLTAAMIQPNSKGFVLLFPFMPIKLRTMAIVFICLEIFNQMTGGNTSNIAYLAHIGGFITAMCVMHFFYRGAIEWDPLRFLGGGGSTRNSGTQMPRGWTVTDAQYADPNQKHTGPVTQAELDALLAKLSVGGINSLTPEEQARLRQAREQMRNQRGR